MNKRELDNIVNRMLQEKKEYTRIEIQEIFSEHFSKDQIERIEHRYRYLKNREGL